jgi:FAD/FMN-containing dehydrogenase
VLGVRSGPSLEGCQHEPKRRAQALSSHASRPDSLAASAHSSADCPPLNILHPPRAPFRSVLAERCQLGEAEATGRRTSHAGAVSPACQAAPDGAACQDVLKNLQNPYYIGDQPGGTQTSGWVDAWTPAPSVYAVAVRNTADVVAAVNFAREHTLRLVVKGGGHSYQGTSSAADSLLIWTRAMQTITLHDAFVAQGCAGTQPAVTIDAGAMWMDVYHRALLPCG